VHNGILYFVKWQSLAPGDGYGSEQLMQLLLLFFVQLAETAAGAYRDILGYQLDYKGNAAYCEHAQNHQA
jgi:hypothetical protein